MPLKNTEVKVGDLTVAITQFPAIKGLKIKARLIKMLLPVAGPMIAPVMDALSSGGDQAEDLLLSGKMDLEKALPKAFAALADVLDENKLMELIFLVLGSASIGGQQLTDEVVFNEHFSGNYNALYKILYEVVMFNNFFDLSGIGKSFTSRITNPTAVPQKS